jgi:ribosome maturation factor RimP
LKRVEIVAQVESIAGSIAAEAGVSLVDVEFIREGKNDFLRVYIDKNGGVGMEDCETVSRNLGAKLDELDIISGQHSLEVSSPGAERVLRKDGEFSHFAGRRVDITLYAPLEQGKRFSGILLGADNGIVSVRTEEGQIVAVPREKIARAKLVLEARRG